MVRMKTTTSSGPTRSPALCIGMLLQCAVLLFCHAAIAQVPTGIVKITSVPKGATVKVAGVPRGKTPTFLELPCGKHKVVIESRGYLPASKSVVVKENKVLRAHVSLVAARSNKKKAAKSDILVRKLDESTEPGTVTIVTTPPGLTVFMNDYLVPQPTPVLFDVRAGIYELIIEDNDAVVLRKTVFVQPGQTLSLELNIKKVRRIDYDDPWK
jgi:hypothetical protein